MTSITTHPSLRPKPVERVNRTLKSIVWKKISLQRNKKWVEVLPKVVMQYNSQVHRTTGYKPKDVNEKNEQEILKNSYTYRKILDVGRFSVGDRVRISKYRDLFTKGYMPNWSNEIFIIANVQNTNPVTYLLKDLESEDVSGGFYELELQKVKHPDVCLVEKVLRKKENKVYENFSCIDEKGWILKEYIVLKCLLPIITSLNRYRHYYHNRTSRLHNNLDLAI